MNAQDQIIAALSTLTTKFDKQQENQLILNTATEKMIEHIIRTKEKIKLQAEQIVSLQNEVAIANKKIAVITKIAKDAL